MDLRSMIPKIRQEFQIPPYFPDDGILSFLREGESRLKFLNPVADLEKDFDFQMLLKNYVNYAYYHKVDEWEKNYAAVILSWQMGSEVGTDADA